MFETGTASDYIDLLDKLDIFLTTKGSAFGLSYVGTGDGLLTAYSGGASSVAETFTLTATSATVFDVVGSVSGDIGDATVGTPFSHAKLEFLISAGGTAFVATDEFTLSTAPKWTTHRRVLGTRVLATQGNDGSWGAQNLVDGKIADSSLFWRVADPVTLPQIVEFELFEASTIAEYQLAAFGSGYSSMPQAWKFQYFSGTWQDLDTQAGWTTWTQSAVYTFPITPQSATKFRLYIQTLNGVNLQIGAVRLLRADGTDAAYSQMIWEAPGNDGTSEILCGLHAFERQDADYFNWELAAFDGYVAATPWGEQVGFHGYDYVPLWDITIPYWFICDGRRVVIIAKLGTQYEVGYMGLPLPYFSPDQWPYPMVLGGSLAFGPASPQAIPNWDSVLWRWSNATNAHRAFTHSDPRSPSTIYPETFQLRARDLTGSWIGFEATKNDAIDATPLTGTAIIWPYRCGLSLLDPNIDGSYATWPVMLMTAAPNSIGELAGVRAVTGQDITAETLITLGSVNWLIVPNISRTHRDDFLTVALD